MTNQAEKDRDRKAAEPAASPVPLSQRQLVILSLIMRPDAEPAPSRP